MSDCAEGLQKVGGRQASTLKASVASAAIDPSRARGTRRAEAMPYGTQEAVASEIISRLLLLHKVPEEVEERPLMPGIGLRERERFLVSVLDADLSSAGAILDKLEARGVSRRQLLLELLPSTAASLGTMWEEDEVSFTGVTLALCGLHEVLRERRWGHDENEGAPSSGPSILLATFEGEQHIFGVMIAAEVFRQAGWRVTVMAGAAQSRTEDCLKAGYFDVLGISAATLADAKGAAAQVDAFREASSNPDLKVMVGGRAFTEREDLAGNVGADIWARDAAIAPMLAAGLRGSSKTRM